MSTTETFTPTGQLYAAERKLSLLARELETQAQCLGIVTAEWLGPKAHAMADHVQLLEGHILELRRITAEIAATRRRLPPAA